MDTNCMSEASEVTCLEESNRARPGIPLDPDTSPSPEPSTADISDSTNSSKSSSKSSQLLSACNRGNIPLAEQLLGQGTNPNACNRHAMTALMMACSKGHVHLVRVLLSAGARLNPRRVDGCTALVLAVQGGHTECALMLLAAGAEVEKADNDGNTPLLAAAGAGNAVVAEALLERGCNVHARNKAGQTALLRSSAHNEGRLVAMLLQAGADVDAADQDPGFTPLMEAAGRGNTAVVLALLQGGASVTHQASSRLSAISAIHLAAQSGHCMVLAALLRAGADVDSDDSRGYTPLMLAARAGHDQAVELLLKFSANSAVQAEDGTTALQMAQSAHCSSEVVDLLLQLGATKPLGPLRPVQPPPSSQIATPPLQPGPGPRDRLPSPKTQIRTSPRSLPSSCVGQDQESGSGSRPRTSSSGSRSEQEEGTTSPTRGSHQQSSGRISEHSPPALCAPPHSPEQPASALALPPVLQPPAAATTSGAALADTSGSAAPPATRSQARNWPKDRWSWTGDACPPSSQAQNSSDPRHVAQGAHILDLANNSRQLHMTKPRPPAGAGRHRLSDSLVTSSDRPGSPGSPPFKPQSPQPASQPRPLPAKAAALAPTLRGSPKGPPSEPNACFSGGGSPGSGANGSASSVAGADVAVASDRESSVATLPAAAHRKGGTDSTRAVSAPQLPAVKVSLPSALPHHQGAASRSTAAAGGETGDAAAPRGSPLGPKGGSPARFSRHRPSNSETGYQQVVDSTASNLGTGATNPSTYRRTSPGLSTRPSGNSSGEPAAAAKIASARHSKTITNKQSLLLRQQAEASVGKDEGVDDKLLKPGQPAKSPFASKVWFLGPGPESYRHFKRHANEMKPAEWQQEGMVRMVIPMGKRGVEHHPAAAAAVKDERCIVM